MQLKFNDHTDFISLFKPRGFRTHRVADDQLGFVEHLESELQQKLFVVHRLDKETSGLMLFAKTQEAAQILSELFESREIKKQYLFLTDRQASAEPATQLTIESHIDKLDSKFVNIHGRPANSKTVFEKMHTLDRFTVYKAYPETGKPHQIRLHAEKAGLQILGDLDHNGSDFFRLCLQAYSLAFTYKGKKFELFAEPESIFGLNGVSPSFANLPLMALENSLFQRQQLLSWSHDECVRVAHAEIPDLKADLYGSVLWAYDYSEPQDFLISQPELNAWADTKNLKVVQRKMLNRGQGVGGKEKDTLSTQDNLPWTAEENNLKVQLKTDSGFSPGLFLDQRHNRKWVLENSKDQTVLNLFSYTSLFSVAAASGGAKTVTTVDVSKKFIEWSKENFVLNGLKPENYEFFVQDVSLFVKGSLKRKRKWSFIICDPPTFGRSQDGTWKIERDLPQLGQDLFDLLERKGRILFTSNLETSTRKELIQLFTKKIKASFTIERLPLNPLDIELTDDISNAMKGFFLIKN